MDDSSPIITSPTPLVPEFVTREPTRDEHSIKAETRAVMIRRARARDVSLVEPNLRSSDRQEIIDSVGSLRPISTILRAGIQQSFESWLLALEGKIAALWGISPMPRGSMQWQEASKVACAWMVTTPVVEQHKDLFLDACWAIFPEVLTKYPCISNWISVKNRRAIKWGSKMGFQFDPPQPYGAYRLPFLRFRFTREMLREKMQFANRHVILP